MVVTVNNENNANNTAVMLIKSLKTHTPQQSVSRPTNVLSTTHSVTMSLSQDNANMKTQKYAHFQRNARISGDFVM